MPLALEYDGKKLNSPNDVVYDDQGRLWFTDPPYGLPGTFKDPAKELPFQGVYRLDKQGSDKPGAARAGALALATRELEAPNGLAFSPDFKTLYVANSQAHASIWKAYTVKADGSLTDARVFFDATRYYKDGSGVPDGLKVDVHGNVFATGPGGVLVLSPEGILLGRIPRGAHGQCGLWRRWRHAVHNGESSRAASSNQDPGMPLVSRYATVFSRRDFMTARRLSSLSHSRWVCSLSMPTGSRGR